MNYQKQITNEQTTPWQHYRAKGWGPETVIRAKYGYSYLGSNQAPYFHITGDIKNTPKRNDYDACGCIHDDISRAYPKLRKLIKWHGVGQGGMQMHYIANAVYFWEKIHGKSKWKAESYDSNPLDALKSTIVFGAYSRDTEKALTRKRSRSNFTAWLERRLPELQRNMDADLLAAGVHRLPGRIYQVDYQDKWPDSGKIRNMVKRVWADVEPLWFTECQKILNGEHWASTADPVLTNDQINAIIKRA